ncbi:hypothetical protein BGY98DRAFT_940286 [Russula aff. rugulosa BPL654]|nr:hypothetical protein BGY98DRAFT_940286 [Russula aff. rugulosa BPL654]
MGRPGGTSCTLGHPGGRRQLRECSPLGIDATQEAEVTALFEHARERLLPFATADWARIWPSFVRDLSGLVSSLAPGVLLEEMMVGIVPALSVAPASPAAPALPEVLISAAESSPSPSPSPSLPSPVALPSPTGTSGPTRASSSGRDRSPQSARGSDVSRASRMVRSLPARTGAPRLASSPGSTTAAAAVAAAAAAPIVAVLQLSLPSWLRRFPQILLRPRDRPDHACVRCSQRRQKCAIPEGRDPLDTSEPCLSSQTSRGGVKRSARLARKASRAATALPKRPSPSLSMKFPDEVPIRPTQGTERASLQELLTWHAEVAASCYAYRDRLAVQDALRARERIIAQELGSRTTAVNMHGIAIAVSRAYPHRASLSCLRPDLPHARRVKDDEEDFGGSAWTGIGVGITWGCGCGIVSCDGRLNRVLFPFPELREPDGRSYRDSVLSGGPSSLLK